MTKNKFKKKRTFLGLSIPQFSKLTGYSERYIYHIEAGTKKVDNRFVLAFKTLEFIKRELSFDEYLTLMEVI